MDEVFLGRDLRIAPSDVFIDPPEPRARTIITHASTLAMVVTILLFGGETLHYFALALTIGIVFGIYSSIFVSAALVMWFGVTREDLVKPAKKKEEAVV